MSRINAALTKLPVLDIFSSKKMLRSAVMNRLGAQPFRIWLAEKRYEMRNNHLTQDISEQISTLMQDGILVIPNFLPTDTFVQLENECLNALEKVDRSRTREDGPNTYSNIDSSKLQDYPTIAATLKNDKILRMFEAAERRDIKVENIVRLLECLVQGDENGMRDPETDLHEDIFFNTHKAWLYITDVEKPQAPFVYVKESHKNKRVNRYQNSYKYSLTKDNVHSRRISSKELKELELSETVFYR